MKRQLQEPEALILRERRTRERIGIEWASIFSPLLFKAAKAFEVGNNIPGVGFKTKNSWAGNLPIAKSTDREVRGKLESALNCCRPYRWNLIPDSSSRSISLN